MDEPPEPAHPLPPNVRSKLAQKVCSEGRASSMYNIVFLIPGVQHAFGNCTRTLIVNPAPEGKQSKGKIKESIKVTFCILGKAVGPHEYPQWGHSILFVFPERLKEKNSVREHQSKKSQFNINMPLPTVHPVFVIIMSKPLPQVMSRGSCIGMTPFQQVTQQLSFGEGFPSSCPGAATQHSEHLPGTLRSSSASVHFAKCLFLSSCTSLLSHHASNEDALSIIISSYCHWDASPQYGLGCNLNNGQNVPSAAFHHRAQSIYM